LGVPNWIGSLTLKQILEVGRMMEQTGGYYPSYHNDHINPNADADLGLQAREEHSIEVRLDYDDHGNIVQK
jgi:hypothetical protein